MNKGIKKERDFGKMAEVVDPEEKEGTAYASPAGSLSKMKY